MQQETIIKELMGASEQLLHVKLDREDISSVLSISHIKMYKKNDIIVGINERITHTGIILNGIVRSYYLDMNGNAITKNFHRKYSLFMDEGLLEYTESICAYEAIEDVVVMLSDTLKLKELIMKSENLKSLYITALESGIRYKIHRESEFLTNNATQRYLQFRNDYPELTDKVKQSYISTYLGITPESLSRIRKALKEETTENGGTYE